MFVSGRPDQVHNCTITNISTTSLSVKCADGFNGGMKQSFMLEVKDMHTQVGYKLEFHLIKSVYCVKHFFFIWHLTFYFHLIAMISVRSSGGRRFSFPTLAGRILLPIFSWNPTEKKTDEDKAVFNKKLFTWNLIALWENTVFFFVFV